jgi:uncharacterized protein (DUF1501 family)
MISRRDFLTATLRSSSLIALAPTVPTFLARTARAAEPARDGRILVVVQLDGGNDGINTVVPYTDEGYAKHRRTLRLPTRELLRLDDRLGLHPSMGAIAKLFQAGQFTIVQGVGYPNPNRSHFRSMAIWHTARFDPEEHNGHGWLGQALDSDKSLRAGIPSSVFVGAGQLPVVLRGRRSVASALTRPEDSLLAAEARPKGVGSSAEAKNDLAAFVERSALDAYATADRMAEITKKGQAAGDPESVLGHQLSLIARLIKGDAGTRVYYAAQGSDSYDTHSDQLAKHAFLLGAFSGALKAFLDDLAAARLAERVVVLAFSEFGRTVRENASGGTDHGTAGPVFLAGAKVKAGLMGQTPSLTDLADGDLKVGIDFRRVYAAVLQDWLGLPSHDVLAGDWKPLPLFSA